MSAALQTFGANVRRHRAASGLTQESLAERAEIDPTYVQRIERGVSNVSMGIILRLARALGTTVTTLVKDVA